MCRISPGGAVCYVHKQSMSRKTWHSTYSCRNDRFFIFVLPCAMCIIGPILIFDVKGECWSFGVVLSFCRCVEVLLVKGNAHVLNHVQAIALAEPGGISLPLPFAMRHVWVQSRFSSAVSKVGLALLRDCVILVCVCTGETLCRESITRVHWYGVMMWHGRLVHGTWCERRHIVRMVCN